MGRSLELTASRKFAAMTIFALCVMSFLLLASITSPNRFSDLTQKFFPVQEDNDSSSPAEGLPEDQSCISRSQKASYHNKLPSPVPSPYFLSKLRDYELRHKNCEPFSEHFNRTLQLLVTGKNDVLSNGTESEYCRYVVYTVNLNGLGNRMLGLSSVFLYALLTDRVVLVDFGPDMDDLFCEPFQNSTWLLPADFPFRNEFYSSKFREAHSFGSLLMRNANFTQLAPPSLLHLFLSFEYSNSDKLFYRDENQEFLRGVPWLTLRSDQYFVPYLFLMPCFKQELERLFPDRETVFHHLSKYLFSPSNQAWGLITRFYDAYLVRADERIGLQLRVFNPTASPIPLFTKQILQCTQKESLLPHLQESTASSSAGIRNKTTPTSTKAVLIASLYREFYEDMKFMFWTRASVDGGGEVVGFHQASHEGSQHSENHSHNMKAWADIYLLSLCDDLVTSPWSTFGYIPQGIGGLKPWILNVPNDKDDVQKKRPGQACTRAVSMEPCFHFPPSYDMRAKVIVDGEVGLHPPLVHCEDVRWGLKLVNDRKID